MSVAQLRVECKSLLRAQGMMQVTLFEKIKSLEGRIAEQRKEIVRLEAAG